MHAQLRNKPFTWSDEKDEILRSERGISFVDILRAIADPNRLFGVRRNRSGKHPGQLVYVVEIDGYSWVVPFVESHDSIVLKTA